MITNQRCFKIPRHNICSASSAWTHDKITFGVLTYDMVPNKQEGKIPFNILKSLNINYWILYQK